VYQGFLLVLERMLKGFGKSQPRLVNQAVTFLFTVVGWTVFRSDNFGMARQWLARMFLHGFHPRVIFPGEWGLIILVLISVCIAHGFKNTFEMKHNWNLVAGAAISVLFLIALLTITAGQQSPFLYFQF
jgi:hypothetical protein